MNQGIWSTGTLLPPLQTTRQWQAVALQTSSDWEHMRQHQESKRETARDSNQKPTSTDAALGTSQGRQDIIQVSDIGRVAIVLRGLKTAQASACWLLGCIHGESSGRELPRHHRKVACNLSLTICLCMLYVEMIVWQRITGSSQKDISPGNGCLLSYAKHRASAYGQLGLGTAKMA